MKQKYIFGLFILFAFVFVITGCSGSAQTVEPEEQVPQTQVESAHDCPRGIENDPVPGMCYLYVDNNSDGYCDHG
jgi:hypothetical protein